MSENATHEFTDLSTASRQEKAVRFLSGMVTHEKYFYDDGFPRNNLIEADAKATLEVLNEALREVENLKHDVDKLHDAANHEASLNEKLRAEVGRLKADAARYRIKMPHAAADPLGAMMSIELTEARRALTDADIGRLSERIIARAQNEAPNSNFRLGGWDVLKVGLIVQALIATLRDEGLLTPPAPK